VFRLKFCPDLTHSTFKPAVLFHSETSCDTTLVLTSRQAFASFSLQSQQVAGFCFGIFALAFFRVRKKKKRRKKTAQMVIKIANLHFGTPKEKI